MLRALAPQEAEELVGRARAGRPVGEDLDRLLARLDAPDPPMASRGGGEGRPPTLLGGFGRRSAQEIYVCPADRCSRVVPRNPGVDAPACPLEQAPLRRTRV